MEQMIELQIPTNWLTGISDEPLTLQQIFRLGLHQYKIERALGLYRDGVGSLGFLAEQTGISKRTLILEARNRGIEPEFSQETILEELA